MAILDKMLKEAQIDLSFIFLNGGNESPLFQRDWDLPTSNLNWSPKNGGKNGFFTES